MLMPTVDALFTRARFLSFFLFVATEVIIPFSNVDAVSMKNIFFIVVVVYIFCRKIVSPRANYVYLCKFLLMLG